MQYVIWLAPFAILNISLLNRKTQNKMLKLYVVWQVFELLFQYAFFQNILTNTGKSRGILLANVEFSEIEYGVTSLTRYVVFILFVSQLIRKVYDEKKGTNINQVRGRNQN